MAERERKITEERDGCLHVPGEEKPLQRDPVRSIYVEVDKIPVVRGFTQEDGKTKAGVYVKGRRGWRTVRSAWRAGRRSRASWRSRRRRSMPTRPTINGAARG